MKHSLGFINITSFHSNILFVRGIYYSYGCNTTIMLKSKKKRTKMFVYYEQEMSLKKTNGVGLKKEENITQARLSTCT